MIRPKCLVFIGGHHTSALAVALALQKKGWTIVWFGHRHSMWGDKADSAEYQEVTTADIPFYDLLAGKFYRTYNPLKLIRLPLGFLQSFIWLLQIRPTGIVSSGGYLAVPTVISGWFLGIPSITHEQIVSAGWANKAIIPFVKKIAVTWPSSLPLYPANKTVLIGLPLRPALLSPVSRVKKVRPEIYITGGKQGSHLINHTVFALLPELLKKYTIIHQTGTSTVFNDRNTADTFVNSNYQHFGFDSQKSIHAMHTADFVIGRAGAHTVYELGVLGKPSILIPIPWVSHHEQEKNAQVLKDSGLAVIVPQSQLTPQSLLAAVEKVTQLHPHKLNLPTDATEKMVKLIEETL